MLGMQAAAAEASAAGAPALTAAATFGLVCAAAASATVAVRLLGRMRHGRPAIDPRPHPAATWSGADVALIALAYVGLLAAAAAVVTPQATLRMQLASDVATKIVATLVGIGVLRATGASWAALGCGVGSWDDLRLACGGLALVLAPLLGIAAVLNRIVPYAHPVVDLLREGRDPVAVGLVVLAAVVVAPLAEEFFFRGALLGWLEARLPEGDGAAAIGLQAAAFAAAHLGHGLAAVPLFLFGLVLGAIARATGTLAPCVLLHAMFNAVSVGLLLAAPGMPAGGGG